MDKKQTIDLRDYENIPLKEDIDTFLEREVEPYVKYPWIVESTRNNIGYEIQFKRHFFVYKSLRPVKDIDKEIQHLHKKISEEWEKFME